MAIHAEHGAAARHAVSDGQVGVVHQQDGRRHPRPALDRLVSAGRAPCHDLLRLCGVRLSHVMGERQVGIADRRAVLGQIANELSMY